MSATKKPASFFYLDRYGMLSSPVYDAAAMDAYHAAQPRAWAWEMPDGTFTQGILFRSASNWTRLVPGRWAQVRIMRDEDE